MLVGRLLRGAWYDSQNISYGSYAPLIQIYEVHSLADLVRGGGPAHWSSRNALTEANQRARAYMDILEREAF